MSKFYFEMPVPLLEALTRLPERSSVAGASFDPQSNRLRVDWECDDLVTPYTFPLEWDGVGEPPLHVLSRPAFVLASQSAAFSVSGQAAASPSRPEAVPVKSGHVKNGRKVPPTRPRA